MRTHNFREDSPSNEKTGNNRQNENRVRGGWLGQRLQRAAANKRDAQWDSGMTSFVNHHVTSRQFITVHRSTSDMTRPVKRTVESDFPCCLALSTPKKMLNEVFLI